MLTLSVCNSFYYRFIIYDWKKALAEPKQGKLALAQFTHTYILFCLYNYSFLAETAIPSQLLDISDRARLGLNNVGR